MTNENYEALSKLISEYEDPELQKLSIDWGKEFYEICVKIKNDEAENRELEAEYGSPDFSAL